MSLLEVQQEVVRLSPTERRLLSRQLRQLTCADDQALENACLAANADAALAAEVEAWQALDDPAIKP